MNGYDIDLFSELTGLELEESQLPVFERALNRAFSMLENELGWSFNYISNYKEIGKVKSICSCPKYLKNINPEDMIQPDEVKGKIKLFGYMNSRAQGLSTLIKSHTLVSPARSLFTMVGELVADSA